MWPTGRAGASPASSRLPAGRFAYESSAKSEPPAKTKTKPGAFADAQRKP